MVFPSSDDILFAFATARNLVRFRRLHHDIFFSFPPPPSPVALIKHTHTMFSLIGGVPGAPGAVPGAPGSAAPAAAGNGIDIAKAQVNYTPEF
jgi:hypothetical protein